MHMDERDHLIEQTNSDEVAQSMADFDEADYRPLLDGLDISDEQASELLRILWDMMRMCIEMNIPAESWGQIVSPLFLAAATDSGTVG